MINLLLNKIFDGDKDKKGKKDKYDKAIDGIVKGNITENERLLLRYILQKRKNIPFLSQIEEVKGGMGSYFLGGITLGDVDDKYGGREDASTLAHELGHTLGIDYKNRNPVAKEVKQVSQNYRGQEELFSDHVARTLLHRINVTPPSIERGEGGHGSGGLRPFRTASDSLNVDYIMKKYLKEL